MYSDIAQNKRRSVYIIVFFVLFVLGLLLLFSKLFNYGYSIFILGTFGALIYTLITYYSGANMALAVNRAVEIKKKDNPRLYRIVENLSITDGLPMPRIFVMDDPSPNAFATGRDPQHSFVCATSGLLDIMDDKELQGVLAHELSHVKNYDIRVMMIAFALTAVISLVADIVIRFTWFNNDERDSNPALLATRYPEGLASALEKIKQSGSSLKVQNTATAHLFFANPLRKHGIANLFSTHPPLDDRIKRLRSMTSHE